MDDSDATIDAVAIEPDRELDALTIDVYNAATGDLVGQVSESDLQLLQDQLVEESDSDDDYYINDAMLEVFEAADAEPRLLEALRAVLVDGEGDVRWERQG